MPRSLAHTLPLLAALVLVAGCSRTGHDVPHFDASGVDYGPVSFKDDAPANTSVDHDHFPFQFIDADGKPVDLSVYQGKEKVVLVVLRGMARSERGRFCPSCL